MPTQISSNKPKQLVSRIPRALGATPTIEYMRTFMGPSLRPNGKMPLSAHEEAGRLLKEVYAASYHRKGVYRSVGSIRTTLDEWAMREYPDHENPTNEEFFKLYYHGPSPTFQRHLSQAERDRHIAGLRRVQEIVVTHYPDTTPLRELLKSIDRAIRLLEAWIQPPAIRRPQNPLRPTSLRPRMRVARSF